MRKIFNEFVPSGGMPLLGALFLLGCHTPDWCDTSKDCPSGDNCVNGSCVSNGVEQPETVDTGSETGTQSAEDDIGGCITWEDADLYTSIMVCRDLPRADCTGDGMWEAETCAEQGMTQSCGDGKYVYEDSECPADRVGACRVPSEDFGHDLCVNGVWELDCVLFDGNYQDGDCAANGFSKECMWDNWVEADAPCPSLELGICIVYVYDNTNAEICFEDEQAECYFEYYECPSDPEERWLSGVSCPDENFTEYCGEGVFVEEGVTCPVLWVE